MVVLAVRALNPFAGARVVLIASGVVYDCWLLFESLFSTLLSLNNWHASQSAPTYQGIVHPRLIYIVRLLRSGLPLRQGVEGFAVSESNFTLNTITTYV